MLNQMKCGECKEIMGKTVRECPLCGGISGDKLLDIPIYMSEIAEFPQKYDIVACENCGMLYADSYLTTKLLDEYYSKFNIYENISSIKKEIYEYSYGIYYDAIQKYIDKSEEILDVGCGNGNVLVYLQQNGYCKLSGLDPSENSIRNIEKKGMPGYCGSIYFIDSSQIKKKFDAIICIGVLEHLLDLHASLRNIMDLLEKEGKIYVAVPCAEGFAEYICEVPNYFNIEHINYFTLATLDRLLSEAGAERISTDSDSIVKVEEGETELIISAVYKKTGCQDKRNEEYDSTGKRAVLQYLEKSNIKERKIAKKIEEIINSNEKYIIWGTGNLSTNILCRFPDLLDKVAFFVDNNDQKVGSTFFGKGVFAPCKIMEESHVHCIICSMTGADVIAKQIESMRNDIDYTILKY